MEKNLILNAQTATWLLQARETSLSITHKLYAIMKKTLNPLRKYYSAVLERPIDVRQTLLLIQAQVAFVLAALPAECPLLLRAAFALWFGWSVRVCKQQL